MKRRSILSHIKTVLLAASLFFAGTANAALYDFDNQVWGTSSIELNNAAGRQTFVEITENLDTLANDVLFKFTNTIPPENTIPYGEAAIRHVYFDTGIYTDLITEVQIWEQSAGVDMVSPSSRPNMDLGNNFDTTFTENFSAGTGAGYPANQLVNGVNPGEYLVLNATLGTGKSFNDLIDALNVGRNADQNIALTGLRISEIVHRIWGQQQDADHAAFVATSLVDLSGPVISLLTASPATILDNQSAQLEVVAYDQEPGPLSLSYLWTILSGGGSLDFATSPTPVYTPDDVTASLTVILQVDVMDGANTVSDILNLQVDDADAPPPNQPPQISALSAMPTSILDSEASQLSVTASDPDNGPSALGYQWTILSGGGTLDFDNSANPVYTPDDVVGTRTVSLQVNVTDGEATTSDTISLQVTDTNPPPPGVELLVEDFSSGSLNGWTVHDEGTVTAPSRWRIVTTQSGLQLAQNSNIQDGGAADDLAHLGTYLSYDDGQFWTDYRLKFAMRTTADNDTMGVMFRINNADNYYRFSWDKQRNQRRLVKNSGGVFTLLAADNVPYVAYQTYQVEIVTQGGQLEVWIDGVRIFQVTDSDHSDGTFGFHTWQNAWAYFDNLLVEDLSGGTFNTAPQITDVEASPASILDTDISNLSVIANDPDNGPSALIYLWTILSGGGVLDDATSTTPVYIPDDVTASQTVMLQVEVTDGENIASSILNLQVDDADAPPPNQPPQISALSAMPTSILDSEASQLSVTASDPDNGPSALSYQWTILSGDGTLDYATSTNPVYTPDDVVGTRTVSLQVNVTDGEATTSDTISLQVTDTNPPPPGVELLVEDFSSGSLNDWTVHDEGTLSAPSRWRIVTTQSGLQLAQNSNIQDGGAADDLAHLGTYLSYDDGQFWTDYRLKFAMRTTADNDTMGVMFRINNADNYYRFSWDKQRNQRRLVKNSGGVFTLLAADNVPYVAYQTYQVEIVTQGGQLEVWIDGVRIFQVTDSDHSDGTFGFHTWQNAWAYFDNLLVEDLSGGTFNTAPQITDVEASPASILDTDISNLSVIANDPDNGPSALIYLWTILSGGGVLDDATSTTPVYIPDDVTASQTVMLQVEVTDGENIASSILNLQVDDADAPPPNQPPQISALSAMPTSILDSEASQLSVTASDPDNGPSALSYQWTILSGDGTLDYATSTNPVYTPDDVVGTRTVSLQVNVTDGEATTSDTISLQVTDTNPPPPGVELLVEDFSSGSLNGWTVHDEGTVTAPSRWRIVTTQSGLQLAQNSNIQDGGAADDLAHLGTYLSYDDGQFWTDYRLKFAMRTTADNDTMGVMFRINNADNYYRFSWDKQRNQRRLVKNSGGVFTLLAADNVPYVAYQTYQVEIVVQSGQLEVWIDDVRIFQVTDADHDYGTFAFYTWQNAWAYFDDVQVEEIQ